MENIDRIALAGNAEPIAGEYIGNSVADASGHDAAAIPRKRGRPRKSESGIETADLGSAINPADLGSGSAGSDASAAGGTGRGRKRAAEKETALSVDTLITALSVAQLTLVTATNIPEFALSEAQTKMLAEASARVARHFPSVLTAKQQDFVGLAVAFGSIGYTQVRAYSARKDAEKKASKVPNVLNREWQS